MNNNIIMRKFLLLILVSAAVPARANVEVVTQSRDSRELKLQSAKVLADINAPARLGRVTETWVFSNAAKQNFEGEFVCEAPEGAIMSGFAYWYRGEKVVAQIVEKERAANIYAAFNPLGVFVRPRRDPALAEKLAANRLKVRIGPIDAGKPLQIELQYIVPCHAKDGMLQLPVKLRGAAPVSVEAFETGFSGAEKSQARWTGGALPDQGSGGPLPESIALEYTKPPALALLKSPQKSGYFAAVLDEASFKRLEKWSGASELRSQVLDAKRVLVAGKFAGAFPASFLKIGAVGDADGARLWWMALGIAALEGDEKNYAQVVALSKASGIPSNFTSWLAIPSSARKGMEDVIDPEKASREREDFSRLGLALAAFKALGKVQTPHYREMLAAFQKLAQSKSDKNFDYYRTQTLADFESSYANNVLYYGLVAYAQKGNDGGIKLPKFRAQFARLGVSDDRSRKNFEALLNGAQQEFAARRALPHIEAQIARGQTPDYGVLNVKAQNLYSDDARKLSESLAKRYVAARGNNPARARFLRAQIVAISKAVGNSSLEGNAISNVENTTARQKLQDDLIQAILKKQEDTPRGQKLLARFEQAKAQTDYFGRNALDFQEQINRAYVDRQIELLRAHPDAAKIAKLAAEEARLTRFSSVSAKDIEDYNLSSWKSGSRNLIAHLWAQEALVSGPDSPRAASLKAKWLQNSPSDAGWLENDFRQAEQDELGHEGEPLMKKYSEAVAKLEAGEAEAKEVESQIRALDAKAIYSKGLLIAQMGSLALWVHNRAVDAAISQQWQNVQPDQKRLGELTVLLQRSLEESETRQDFTNWTFRRFWTTPSEVQRTGGAPEYARLKVERLGVRQKLATAAKKLATSKNISLEAQVQAQNEVALLRQRDNQLKVRMGDPLIAVKAPRDCQRVIALLPSGEIVKLEFNPRSGEFEARFDVPTWVNPGPFRIEVWVVFASGARQRLTMTFGVDTQAPTGTGTAVWSGNTLKLRLETGRDTDRVSAFVDGNERIELRREGEAFVGETALSSRLQSGAVRFVVTDQAHNRSEIRVELRP